MLLQKVQKCVCHSDSVRKEKLSVGLHMKLLSRLGGRSSLVEHREKEDVPVGTQLQNGQMNGPE